jgi:hypothetical protein
MNACEPLNEVPVDFSHPVNMLRVCASQGSAICPDSHEAKARMIAATASA